MFGRISRVPLAVPVVVFVAAVVSGCNSSSPTEGLGIGASAEQQQPVTPVVQAYCPKVVLLEEDATHRAYARGGNDDPQKLLYQASLADVTRQCTANETTITINVVAQGRLVRGAAGTPGRVTLPILVEVFDGDDVIYSQKVAYPVDLTEGGTQFIFAKPDVQIPNAIGGASRFTRVRLGFDAGGKRRS